MSRGAGLAEAVRVELAVHADPERAKGQQAYMKSQLPYRGLTTAVLRQVCSQVFAAHPLAGFDQWQAAVLELWREAEFREERYAAVELTGDRRYREYQTPATVPLYEELVVTGAWWDLVDPVATKRLAGLLRAHRADIEPVVRAWSTDAHLWKRRAALICQVGFHRETDPELLFACIDPNLDDRDFFIRKGIGWALREYSKVAPTEVLAYVTSRRDRLSALSRREALKHVPPQD